MKEIKAYIREDRMTDVVRGLRTRGARAITVVRVVPLGTVVREATCPVLTLRAAA